MRLLAHGSGVPGAMFADWAAKRVSAKMRF